MRSAVPIRETARLWWCELIERGRGNGPLKPRQPVIERVTRHEPFDPVPNPTRGESRLEKDEKEAL